MIKVLLTNDDGIGSEGIQKLAGLLRSDGRYKLSVIAPDNNRSGISNALSLIGGPVKLSAVSEDSWSCSGFPADCVLIGLRGIITECPDIVISGINRGANLGSDIIYSGTAAAARQASLSDIPAIALSLAGFNPFNWDMAASWTVEHLEKLLSLWKKGSFLNVNIPNSPARPKGMETTSPAARNYKDRLELVSAMDGNQWCFLYGEEDLTVSEEGSDCYSVSRNLVSVSIVRNYPAVLESTVSNPADG